MTKPNNKGYPRNKHENVIFSFKHSGKIKSTNKPQVYQFQNYAFLKGDKVGDGTFLPNI